MARLKGGSWNAAGGSQLPDVEGSVLISEWGSDPFLTAAGGRASTRRQSQWLRAGAGAGMGVEDDAFWTPEVRRDEAAHLEAPSWMTEPEEVLHPKWSLLQKRLHLVNGEGKKRKELLWAIENVHNLMTYCKGRDVTDRMKGLVDRFNWVANGTGYKRVAKALEDPKRIMEAIERILDGECLNRSEELQNILIPLIKEANIHRHQLLALQGDEQEHRVAGVQMRVMMEDTNNLEASYRELMQETSSFLKGAIGRCRADYNSVGQDIVQSAKRRRELASQREKQEVEMYDLERRQRQSHFAIQESEARCHSVHHAHQKQKEILQTELSHIQRDTGAIDKLRDKLLLEINQAWANLEAAIEENMKGNLKRMLELRYGRKQREWAAKSKRLRALRVEREKQVEAKEHLLEEERSVLISERARREVLEFRLSCLEAKGLWVALLARLRELTRDGLVAQPSMGSSEAPPPKAEEMELPQGLLQTLAAELELQQRWLAERGQAWQVSPSTLTLLRRPPLATPLSLGRAIRVAQRSGGVRPQNVLQGIIAKQQLVRRSILAMSPTSSSRSTPRSLSGAAAWGAALGAALAGAAADGGDGRGGVAGSLTKLEEGSTKGAAAAAAASLPAAAAAAPATTSEGRQRGAAEGEEEKEEEFAETSSLSGSMEERCGTALDEVLSTASGMLPFLERPKAGDWTLEELRHAERLVGDLKPMEQRITQLLRRWGAWRAVKGRLGLPYMQMLIKELDSLCGDLRDGWDLANACLHWLTDGAAFPGTFTDELFRDLAFLPPLVERLARRCGVVAALLQALEDGSVNRDRLSFSIVKCYELSCGQRDVLTDEDFAQAQAWLLRVGSAMGMRSALQVEGKDALNWYVSSVRQQGGKTLEAVGRGAQALQVITNGAQMDEIRECAMVAEFNDIVLAALKAALEVDDPDAYNAAVLVLGSLDAVARGEEWGVLEAWAAEVPVRRAASSFSSQGEMESQQEEEEAQEEQVEQEEALERLEPFEGIGGPLDLTDPQPGKARGAEQGASELQHSDGSKRRGSHLAAGDAVGRTKTDHDAPELLCEGDGEAPQLGDHPEKLDLKAVADALMDPPRRRKTVGGRIGQSGSYSRSSSRESRSSRGSRGSHGSRGSSQRAGRRSSQNSEEQPPERPGRANGGTGTGKDATPRSVADAAERWKITTARRATIRPAGGDAQPSGLSNGGTGLRPPRAARGPAFARPDKPVSQPDGDATRSGKDVFGSRASHAADTDRQGPGAARELDAVQPGRAPPAAAPAASADVAAGEERQVRREVEGGHKEDKHDQRSDGTASTRDLSPAGHDDQLHDFLQSDDLRGGSTLSTLDGQHLPGPPGLGLEEGSELWIELQYELRDRRKPTPKSREASAEPGKEAPSWQELYGLSAIGTQLIAAQGAAFGDGKLSPSPDPAGGLSLQALLEQPAPPGLLVTSTRGRLGVDDQCRSPEGSAAAQLPPQPYLSVPDRTFGSSSPTRFHYTTRRPGTSSSQERGESRGEPALKFTLQELQDLQLIGIRSATAKRRSHRGMRLKPRSTSWPMFPLGMDGMGIRATALQEPHRSVLQGHLYGLYGPHAARGPPPASRRSSSRPSLSVINTINAERRRRAMSLGEACELLIRQGPWALDPGQLFIGRTPSRDFKPQGMSGQAGRSQAGQLRKDRWYVVTGKETAPDFVVVGAKPNQGMQVSKAVGESAQGPLRIREEEEEQQQTHAPAVEAPAGKPARVLRLKGNWLPVAKAEPEPKPAGWWEPWMSLAAEIEPLAASTILAKVEAETRPGTSCSASEESSQTSYCGFGPRRVSPPNGGLALVGPGARRAPNSGRHAPEPGRRAAAGAAGGSRDGVVASIESFTQVMLPHVANPMPEMYTTARRPKRGPISPPSSLLSPPTSPRSPDRLLGSSGSPTTAALALRSGYVVGTPEVSAACLGNPVVPEGCGPRAPGTVLKNWPAKPALALLPASRTISPAASLARASPRVSPSRSGGGGAAAAARALGAGSVSPPQHRAQPVLPRQRRVLIPP